MKEYMNKSRIWLYLCLEAVLVLMALPAAAQRFFNLTSQEVKVDSILPQFVYSLPLQGDYQDSIYTVTVKYPEYVDMPATDISHYNRLSGAALPEQVAICQQVTECRKQGLLVISFSPLVFREHRYQALVSFMLDIQAKPLTSSQQEARLQTRAGEDFFSRLCRPFCAGKRKMGKDQGERNGYPPVDCRRGAPCRFFGYQQGEDLRLWRKSSE